MANPIKIKMIEKASQSSVETLKEIIITLQDDFSDEVDHVLDAAMSALETKIPEDEYVAFCNSL